MAAKVSFRFRNFFACAYVTMKDADWHKFRLRSKYVAEVANRKFVPNCAKTGSDAKNLTVPVC